MLESLHPRGRLEMENLASAWPSIWGVHQWMEDTSVCLSPSLVSLIRTAS